MEKFLSAEKKKKSPKPHNPLQVLVAVTFPLLICEGVPKEVVYGRLIYIIQSNFKVKQVHSMHACEYHFVFLGERRLRRKFLKNYIAKDIDNDFLLSDEI